MKYKLLKNFAIGTSYLGGLTFYLYYSINENYKRKSEELKHLGRKLLIPVQI